MSLLDKLKEAIAAEEPSEEQKLKDQLAKLEEENKKLKEGKTEDPHKALKDQIEALTKANKELTEAQGKQNEDASSSSEKSEKETAKTDSSAFPPPNSKGVITQEMIRDLPDTPENREFLIKNIDTVSRAMSN